MSRHQDLFSWMNHPMINTQTIFSAFFQDVVEWYSRMPMGQGLSYVNYTMWTHLDFTVATDAKTLLYEPTINVIQNALRHDNH